MISIRLCYSADRSLNDRRVCRQVRFSITIPYFGHWILQIWKSTGGKLQLLMTCSFAKWRVNTVPLTREVPLRAILVGSIRSSTVVLAVISGVARVTCELRLVDERRDS